MQSLNSPHHSMGPSMSPGPYMSSPMGMSAGSMGQCMGGPGGGGRDFFGEAPGSPRSRSAMDAKSYRRSYTHAKPPYRSGLLYPLFPVAKYKFFAFLLKHLCRLQKQIYAPLGRLDIVYVFFEIKIRYFKINFLKTIIQLFTEKWYVWVFCVKM